MVHPKTEELYRQNNYEYVQKTEDYVHKNFDDQTEGKPKRYRVDQVYRVKHGTQDFILYNLTTLSTDVFGNEVTKNEIVGTHPEPKFNKRFDDSAKRTVTVGVAGEEIKYDIPATKKAMDEVLAKSTEDYDTKFVLVNGNIRYGSFTAEEFRTKHFDDLLHRAQHGGYPEQAKPFSTTGGGSSTGSSGGVREVKKGLIVEDKKGGSNDEDTASSSADTTTTTVIPDTLTSPPAGGEDNVMTTADSPERSGKRRT